MADIHAYDLRNGDRLVARFWQPSACWTWGRKYTVRNGAIRCNFNFPHGLSVMEELGEFKAFSKIDPPHPTQQPETVGSNG